MIAIPSQPITITTSNVSEGDGTIAEWTAGTYALHDLVKVTSEATTSSVYIGEPYICLSDTNSTHPLNPDSKWERLNKLSYTEMVAETEWVAGSYSTGDVTKITTYDSTTKYIGKIYKSLAATNTTVPTDPDSDWREIDVLEYNNAITYSAGDVVSELTTHNKYLSMEDANNTSPLSTDSKWQFIGKTNRYDFSDFYFSTVTEVINQSIEMTLTFSGCDHMSLFGVFGSTITVEELDANNPTDPPFATHELAAVDTSSITTYATYLQFVGCSDVNSYQVDLQTRTDMMARVTIEQLAYNGEEIAELATLTVGRQMNLGCTLYGVKSTRTAITPPTYDKWGDVNLLGDDFVKTFTGKMEFDTHSLDYIDYIIDSLFNKPAVYLLTDNVHKSFNTYGLMTVGELNLVSVGTSSLPLKIKSFKYKRNEKEC